MAQQTRVGRCGKSNIPAMARLAPVLSLLLLGLLIACSTRGDDPLDVDPLYISPRNMTALQNKLLSDGCGILGIELESTVVFQLDWHDIALVRTDCRKGPRGQVCKTAILDEQRNSCVVGPYLGEPITQMDTPLSSMKSLPGIGGAIPLGRLQAYGDDYAHYSDTVDGSLIILDFRDGIEFFRDGE